MSLVSIATAADFNVKSETRQGPNRKIQNQVSQIIDAVIQGGDQAVLEFAARFDGQELEFLRVPAELIAQAEQEIDAETRRILLGAIENIKDFHRRQLQSSWKVHFDDGTDLGEKVTPLDRVGLYVPGGKAFYPSSMIMNVVPAQLAGVPQVVVASPPGKQGLPHPLVLGLCGMLGIEEVYTMGGAQAVAALAYGTESIVPVAKITGPGNAWVAEAKRQVFGQVGIDSIAGPSEILILHDDPEVPTEYLVRDMLSQAEHDLEAQSILITTSRETALAVQARLDELVPTLPRAEIITASLQNQGKILLVERIEEGIALANQIAPEHLELLVPEEDEEDMLDLIRNAGAIFIGQWSSEPVGDYYAGPNHTIPTGGAARYAAPLSVRDFQKHSSLIRYSKKRLLKEGEDIAKFADLEELNAHASAVRVRLENLND
ncbi:MAG: histidinol dehydrogenase [bacterium]|nr:histidinol dehydrogenase [bacterium]